ncbi:MAG TPA: hypothetical protein VEK34_06930 [Methylocella sp.]|nr:hypothetical protein [Methylocella sp.]
MPKETSEIASELASLREAIDRLEQGLGLMLDTQGTHSELLREILHAAAVPTEAEQPLTDMVAQLISTMNEQHAELTAIGAVLRRLPADVGLAVAGAVRNGLKGI